MRKSDENKTQTHASSESATGVIFKHFLKKNLLYKSFFGNIP